MNLEINKELVLSTAHITQKDSEWITEQDYNFSTDTANLRVLVFDVGQERRYMPERLLMLRVFALSHGCKWLVLDCDGPVVDSLPVFDW